MDLIAVGGALVLAGLGSGGAEWLRLRRGWMPRIPSAYGWALAVSSAVVLANALLVAPGSAVGDAAPTTGLLLVVGVLIYGVVWLLLLQGWDAVWRGWHDAAP